MVNIEINGNPVEIQLGESGDHVIAVEAARNPHTGHSGPRHGKIWTRHFSWGYFPLKWYISQVLITTFERQSKVNNSYSTVNQTSSGQTSKKEGEQDVE